MQDNPMAKMIEEVRASPVMTAATGLNGSCSSGTTTSNNCSTSSSVFASLFASTTALGGLESPQAPPFTDLIRAMACPDRPSDLAPSSTLEPISLCLATNHGSSIFGSAGQERRQYAPPQPTMSATALLQKAAQMGAATTSGSFLRGLGLVSSSPSSSGQQDNMQWGPRQVEPENASVPSVLGLGTPPVFGPKQTTLDFLGLGMAVGGSSSSGLSALITSIGGGGLDMTSAAASFGAADYTGKDMGRSS